MFRNIVLFHGETLLAPRQTLNLKDLHLSAVCDFLFCIIATTIHIWRSFLHRLPENAPAILCWHGPTYHVKFRAEDNPKASYTMCVCNICPEITGVPSSPNDSGIWKMSRLNIFQTIIVWHSLAVLWLFSWKNLDIHTISIQWNGYIVAILCDLSFILKLNSVGPAMGNFCQEWTSARLGMSVNYCEGPGIYFIKYKIAAFVAWRYMVLKLGHFGK